MSKKKKRVTPKKAVSKKVERVTPPKADYWAEKWTTLRMSLRQPVIVDRIWSGLLTKEEREQVEKDDSIGPDIVDIWAKLRGISPNQASVDLGVEVNLISNADRQRLLRKLGEEPKTPIRGKPSWDKSTGELRVGEELARCVRRPEAATNITRILDAFEEEEWPRRIEDPLPPDETLKQIPQQRLQEAVKSLNSNLKRLRFRLDGTGEGIIWHLS